MLWSESMKRYFLFTFDHHVCTSNQKRMKIHFLRISTLYHSVTHKGIIIWSVIHVRYIELWSGENLLENHERWSALRRILKRSKNNMRIEKIQNFRWETTKIESFHHCAFRSCIKYSCRYGSRCYKNGNWYFPTFHGTCSATA